MSIRQMSHWIVKSIHATTRGTSEVVLVGHNLHTGLDFFWIVPISNLGCPEYDFSNTEVDPKAQALIDKHKART